MPAPSSALFCTGAVTSASNSPAAQASAAALEHRDRRVGVGRVRMPGHRRGRERVAPDLAGAAGRRERRGIVVGETQREADPRGRAAAAARCRRRTPGGPETARARAGRRSSRTAPGRSRPARPSVIGDRGQRRVHSACHRAPRSRRRTPRPACRPDRQRRRAAGSADSTVRACANPSSGVGRAPEDPQSLERRRRHRSRRCAGPRGRAAARGLRARTPGTGRAPPGSGRTRPPGRRWRELRSYHAPGGSAISTAPPSWTIGATSSASPHMNCVSRSRTSALPGNASGIARMTGNPVAPAARITWRRYGISR